GIPRSGPRTQEYQVLGLHVQGAEGLADGEILDVTDEIEVETVGAEGLPRRAGFDARQVHPAQGEFIEGAHQAAGNIGQGEDDGGVVVAGAWWWGDASAHGHETGAGATNVSHIVDKLSQTEQVGRTLGG